MRKLETKLNHVLKWPFASMWNNSQIRSWALAVCLAGMALAVYWPATGHDYVNYDDQLYVTDNPHVLSGLKWDEVKWVFGNPVANNWHPLTMLSHMLDCQMFGVDPWGHHLTSVLLHAAQYGPVFAVAASA